MRQTVSEMNFFSAVNPVVLCDVFRSVFLSLVVSLCLWHIEG